MFGIHFCITPLPNSTPKGLEIRNKLHDAYDMLFDTFTEYRKVPIPFKYFTTNITDTVITHIIKPSMSKLSYHTSKMKLTQTRITMSFS
jgi:hypothetical protein